MWWILSILVIGVAEAGKYGTDDNLPGLRWFTIETERAAIHYPDTPQISAARTAREVASVTDEILERVEVAQGAHINETVHIVVLDHDDALSGFTIPQWDWVVISAHQGPDLHRTRGRQAWIPGVLAHELGHLVAHKRAGSLAEGANYGLQLGLFGERGIGLGGATLNLSHHEPYWWAEGGAEYLSERAGYNWWSTTRDANLRTTVLDGRLLSWRELQSNRDKDAWNDAERGYQQGYAFARWIDETHGLGTFASIAEEARKGLGRWDRALTQALGEPGHQAWDRFAEDLDVQYREQRDEVEAAGVVAGEELATWPGAWTARSLRTRDVFDQKPRREREEARGASGTWNLFPRYSSDGAWFGEHRVGWIRVRRLPESSWAALSDDGADSRDAFGTWIPARFGYGFDFVPGEQALVLTAPVGTDRPSSPAQKSPYEWNQLFLVDLTPETARRPHREGRESYEKLHIGSQKGQIRRRYRPIPGSERGSDPAVSPDGKQVAWLQYADGTQNLVVSDLDGGNKRSLSAFDDGTWLNGPDWSPGGDEIVVAVSRNYQQNLWIVDVASGDWTAITDDGWEELDPHWAADGIYFAADPSGIFDIYRWSDGHVVQITRVVGGATSPSITPTGNLLYSHYTAFGYKAYGLRRDAFLEVPSIEFDEPGDVDLSWRPDIEDRQSTKYAPLKSIATPSGGPIGRLDLAADGLSPRGGGYLKFRDYLEDHDLSFYGLVGRDLMAEGSYTFRGFRPDVQVWGSWEDDTRAVLTLEPTLSRTLDRRTLAGVGGKVSWPYNDHLSVDVEVFRLALGYAPNASAAASPFLSSNRASLAINLGDSKLARLVDDGEKWLRIEGMRAQSALAEPEPDDGERLDTYGYNQLRSTLRLALPFGSGPHQLDFGWDLVFTDSNVHREEEPRAGGDHTYALRMAVLDPSAPMPGFAPYALRGEEVVIGHLGWRLPLIRRFAHQRGTHSRGPFAEQIWARLGTDAGNVWGVDGTTDYDEPLLVDVSAEIRLAASLFDTSWDSAIGIAHGFQTVAYPRSVVEPIAKPLGADSSGMRLFVGIGTGW